VRHYRPAGRHDVLPCLYWIHGGGHVLGQIEQDDLAMDHIVDAVGCAVVSVEWRRPPEHPFPAPMDDCYAGLAWTHRHAAELGVDPARIAIGGASSGGGSAAGLALLARDRGELPVRFQLLIYPMLDDRNVTPASQALTDPRVWNRASNLIGWRAYLGDAAGTGRVSPYAAPTRAASTPSTRTRPPRRSRGASPGTVTTPCGGPSRLRPRPAGPRARPLAGPAAPPRPPWPPPASRPRPAR
jgi:acetyl esterase/lipase